MNTFPAIASVFIDRKKELDKLLMYFNNLQQDRFGLVFITGDAGSGKTRLAERFEAIITQKYPELIVAKGCCNAQTGIGDPYLPFRGILKELVEDIEEKRKKQDNRKEIILKKLLIFSTNCIIENAPDLIDTFVPGGKILSKFSKSLIEETQVKEKLKRIIDKGKIKSEMEESHIQEQYTNLLRALSQEYKILLFIDDLQWADDASISLLFHLARSMMNNRIMFICLYRKSDVSIGRDGARHPIEPVVNELQRIHGDIYIDLDDINVQDIMDFTNNLIDIEPNKLDENFRGSLFNITNGNALFTSELLLNLKENGSLIKDEYGNWIENEIIDWSTIPPKVEGVIKERICRLEDSMKDILYVASVQGKDFLVQVISRILEIADRELIRDVSKILEKQHKLVKEGKTQRLGRNILSYFHFTDSIMQHFLYNELSESEKILYSTDIAEILEEYYGDNTDEISVELSHLYNIAGNNEKTAAYANKAGKRAFKVSAYKQAIRHFRLALLSLEQLPDNAENRSLKLDILIHLSLSLKPIKGWADPEVISYCKQAIDLGYELNALKQISSMIFGLWVNYLMNLELEKAENYALEYKKLGNDLHEPEILLQANIALANTTYWMGEIQKAYNYTQDFFRIYKHDVHVDQLDKYGQDPRTLAMLFACLSSFLLGDIVGAKTRLGELLKLAEGLQHPFSLAISLQTGAYLEYHMLDFDRLAYYANQLLEVSEKNEFIFYLGLGKIFKGVVLGKEGKYEEAITLINDGYFKGVLEDGGRLLNSLYGLLMADTAIWNKQYPQAIEVIERVEKISREWHEMCYFSELLRLRGKALFESGEMELARGIFQDSLQYAQQMKMVPMELKTLLELSKFEDDKQGNIAMLEDCLSRFISTMEYADIKTANQIIVHYKSGRTT